MQCDKINITILLHVTRHHNHLSANNSSNALIKEKIIKRESTSMSEVKSCLPPQCNMMIYLPQCSSKEFIISHINQKRIRIYTVRFSLKSLYPICHVEHN